MPKLRSDSKWNELTDDQRETLTGWLLEENISYEAAADRLQKEFGITFSITGLSRFYRHVSEQRMEAELVELNSKAENFESKPFNVGALGNAAMALVANRLVRLATEKPDKVRELASLARILLIHRSVAVKEDRLGLEQERADVERRERDEAEMEHKAEVQRRRAYLEKFKAVFEGREPGRPDAGLAGSPSAPTDSEPL